MCKGHKVPSERCRLKVSICNWRFVIAQLAKLRLEIVSVSPTTSRSVGFLLIVLKKSGFLLGRFGRVGLRTIITTLSGPGHRYSRDVRAEGIRSWFRKNRLPSLTARRSVRTMTSRTRWFDIGYVLVIVVETMSQQDDRRRRGIRNRLLIIAIVFSGRCEFSATVWY